MEENLLQDLRTYLSILSQRFYGMDITPANVDVALDTYQDERDLYPRYLYWILPEFSEHFESPEFDGHKFFLVNTVWHMLDLLNFSYPITERFYEQLVPLAPGYGRFVPELKEHKGQLGIKVHEIMFGLQKFVWSFLVWHTKNRGLDIRK